ncbi:DUF3097 domain-containing protein [Brachybacterium sp. J144]|uniref:DUF3097 domain-containing protein n=1 Tax=Brachybacterium sp. J144 TaxID=3116487 RepID=UPI003FA5D5A2
MPGVPAASSFPDRYGRDVLSSTPPAHHRRRPVATEVPARKDLVVEEASTGFTGAVTRVEKIAGELVVELEDGRGVRRTFPLGPGFMIDGKPVVLTRAVAQQAPVRKRSASGSVYVEGARARTARASRIWVEGTHDAELVHKVWGHDLRIEGVVVEQLEGADNLVERVQEFAPSPTRRLGILVDHLVPGSKESRIAQQVMRLPGAAGNVIVLGHPYVDVWQAVKPARVGLDRWPHVPKGTDIKIGTLAALGWPHGDKHDVGLGWKRILETVRSYADVEPTLSGRIEELIDFVTVD